MSFQTFTRVLLVALLFSAPSGMLHAQENMQFGSLDSLLRFAERNSAAIKNAQLQSLSAKWTKIAAMGNTLNLRSPFTASWTDNTQLPVSYLPAQAFGGPEGSFKQVSLGQQYVTSYAISPQLDIINPNAWARVRSAELNKQLTEANNLMARKSLFESIAAAYYNVISLNAQVSEMQRSLNAADSIASSVGNKVGAGIAREQELNNARVNALTIKDRLNQLVFSLEQNMLSLKILCDIKPETKLEINEGIAGDKVKAEIREATSSLAARQAQLQSSYLKSELGAGRWGAFSPTLSLVFNQTWQQNSNVGFTDASANKFSAQYVGLRLTMPFPLDVTRLSSNYTTQINYQMARINSDHVVLQTQTANKQLNLEYQKSYSTYSTAKEVSELKESNYRKSLAQFNEGILSADMLLTAYNDMVNARLNYTVSYAALKYNEARININNTVQ